MKLSVFLGIFLLFASVFVSADTSDYTITSVYVNSMKVTDSNKIQVELGSTAQIQVFVEGTGERDDVRISAWIGGYEYGSVETSTEVFEVEDGVSYKKILYVEVPEDLDVSSNEYTLHIDIYDSTSKESLAYTLYFEEERHDVIVEDILLSANTVAPGDYVGVKVRLENQGYTDEEDVKIIVSIAELGISNAVYMDELLSGDQTDASSVYLVLPSDASGDYELLVTVYYNNGYSTVTESTFLSVEGEMVYDENTFVSISSIPTLTSGEESSYKVQVTNLGESAKTFLLTVDGFDAEYVESITVPAGSSGEFIFTLHPENEGTSYVLVEVSTDEGLVTQELFTVDVETNNSLAFVFVGVLFAILVFAFSIRYFWRK